MKFERLKDTTRFSFSGMGPQTSEIITVVVEGWVGEGGGLD